jgi:hypothetical protein
MDIRWINYFFLFGYFTSISVDATESKDRNVHE